MAVYVHNEVGGSPTTPWFDTFANATIVSVSATLAVFRNTDGSETRLSGSGFAVGTNNNLSSGTVTSASRTIMGGGTVYETVTGLTVSAAALTASDAPGALVFAGDDDFTGFSGVDQLNGYGGSDLLRGRGSDDTLVGGDGFDIFFGGAGNDTFYGAGPSGALESGPPERFSGGRADYSSNDVTGPITVSFGATQTVTGAGAGTDTLIGVQQVRGTAQNDAFTVQAGYSNLLFGAFAEFEGRAGNDIITGLTGVTVRASYQSAANGVTVDLAAGTAQSTLGGDAANVGVDTLILVNHVRGSAFDDTISSLGARGNFQFIGGGGNDTLIGTLEGINNFDSNQARYENATAGVTVVLGASGGPNGTVTGDASVGSDTLINIEQVRGSRFADTLTATASFVGQYSAFNTFEGDAGDDTITGNGITRLAFRNAEAGVTVNLQTGTSFSSAAGDVANVGTDTILGGVNAVIASDYADTLIGNNGSYAERFVGQEGNDFIDGGGGLLDQVNYRTSTSAVTVNLATGTASDGFGTTDTFVNIEGVGGSEFNDTITGDDNVNYLGGQSGDDTIRGGGGNDFIEGDDAIDPYAGAFGEGTIFDSGNDMLFGDAGDDAIDGSLGDDTVNGGTGADVLVGAAGNDTLDDGGVDAASIRDVMYGGSGNDVYNVYSTLASALDIVDEGEGNAAFGGLTSDSDTVMSHGEFFWDFYSAAEILRIADDANASFATTYLVGGKNTNAQIFGNDGSNIISTYGGSKTVDAGGGTDAVSFSLYDLPQSSNGVNTLVSRAGTGIDYLYDFESNVDKVDLRSFNFGISGQQVLDQGINVFGNDQSSSADDYCYFYLTNAGGVDNYVAFVGLTTAQLHAADFITA